MSDGQPFFARVPVSNRAVGKERKHRRVEFQFALLGGDGNECCHDAFGDGSQAVNVLAVIRVKGRVHQNLAIPNGQQTVDGKVLFANGA